MPSFLQVQLPEKFNHLPTFYLFSLVHVWPDNEPAGREGSIQWICGEAEWCGYKEGTWTVHQFAGAFAKICPGKLVML